MKKEIHDFIESYKKSPIMDKILIALTAIFGPVFIGVALYYFIVDVLPLIVVTAVIGLPVAYYHSQSKKEQQARIQDEEIRNFMWFYEQTARKVLSILKEYNVPLGIAPTTVKSIYSAEKFIRVPGLQEPILIFSIERKSSDTADISDIKSAIQQRFNQEDLWLYLIRIDQSDSQFLRFYILPIQSDNARNWAIADRKRQFIHTRPQEPGDRKDKDF